LAGIVGPVLFTNVFALFIGASAPVRLPGAPWLLAALLLGTGFLVGWRHTRPAAAAGRRRARPHPGGHDALPGPRRATPACAARRSRVGRPRRRGGGRHSALPGRP